MMFPILVTVCVPGAASMFLHIRETAWGLKPIDEPGPRRSKFSDEGIEMPSPS